MLIRSFPAGQTLIETVAALAVAIIVVAALVGMAVTGLRSSNLSRSKAIAAQLLSEEVERARIYRDANSFGVWKSDLGLGSQSCSSGLSVGPVYIDSDLNIVSGAGAESVSVGGLSFSRSFNACLADAAGSVVQISALVSWTDSTGTHPVRSTTYLSDWR